MPLKRKRPILILILILFFIVICGVYVNNVFHPFSDKRQVTQKKGEHLTILSKNLTTGQQTTVLSTDTNSNAIPLTFHITFSAKKGETKIVIENKEDSQFHLTHHQISDKQYSAFIPFPKEEDERIGIFVLTDDEHIIKKIKHDLAHMAAYLKTEDVDIYEQSMVVE